MQTYAKGKIKRYDDYLAGIIPETTRPKQGDGRSNPYSLDDEANGQLDLFLSGDDEGDNKVIGGDSDIILGGGEIQKFDSFDESPKQVDSFEMSTEELMNEFPEGLDKQPDAFDEAFSVKTNSSAAFSNDGNVFAEFEKTESKGEQGNWDWEAPKDSLNEFNS